MQVIDKRVIWFDSPALLYCITASPRAAVTFGLPGGSPSEVRFFPKERVIEILYVSKDATHAARMSAESLGALLVSYCVRAKIPMPRVAEKSVKVEADGIALEFVTRLERAPAPETANSSNRVAAAVTKLNMGINGNRAQMRVILT